MLFGKLFQQFFAFGVTFLCSFAVTHFCPGKVNFAAQTFFCHDPQIDPAGGVARFGCKLKILSCPYVVRCGKFYIMQPEPVLCRSKTMPFSSLFVEIKCQLQAAI